MINLSLQCLLHQYLLENPHIRLFEQNSVKWFFSFLRISSIIFLDFGLCCFMRQLHDKGCYNTQRLECISDEEKRGGFLTGYAKQVSCVSI
jgi:hypothetical protein